MIDPMAPIVAFVIVYFIEWYRGGPRGPRGV
ncbi:MAG TPA: hypothetical protein [Caudoviricetes sp.]|jgi:hypothetical protein|nr:MAG TPA: hypothetical protein [Caudoviricetes sp.]